MPSTNQISLVQLGTCAITLVAGAAFRLAGAGQVAGWIWLSGAAIVLVAVLADTAVALWHKKFGLDLIALVSIAGAIVLEEYFTAAVIALMFASGRALEGYAEKRAHDEMSALLGKAPRIANRYENGQLVQVPLAAIRPGDRLAVRPGETVPVDGTLIAGATVDESSLTGESLPVSYAPGKALGSGVVNAGDAFDLLATSTAENSTFSNIIRLVQAAQASKAPAARLADLGAERRSEPGPGGGRGRHTLSADPCCAGCHRQRNVTLCPARRADQTWRCARKDGGGEDHVFR